MDDPHPPDPKYGWRTCPAGPNAWPGDGWTCPGCGRVFVAIDGDDDETFEWKLDPEADQPPYVSMGFED